MLNDVYNDDLKKLKNYFYIIDRLIAIYLPDLAEHFIVNLKIY
jgi:hypothetical protein